MNTIPVDLQKKGRYPQLDGLRGISAVVVLIWHVYLIAVVVNPELLNSYGLTKTFASIVIAGPQAVIVFFILSGFVLTLPFLARKQTWKQYYPSRLIRLYLPTFASLIVAAVLILLIPRNINQHSELKGTWFDTTNLKTIDINEFLYQATLITPFLNNPTWSLFYEIIFSMALPLYIWYVVKVAKKFPLVHWGLLVAVSVVGYQFDMTAVWCLPVFGLGVFVAVHFQTLQNTVAKALTKMRPSLLVTVTVLGSVILLTLPNTAPLLNLPPLATKALGFGGTLVGANLIVVGVLFVPVLVKIFATPVLTFLGKISFSLYLLHVPIIVSMVYLFPSEQIFLALGLGTIATFLASIVFLQTVETPSQKLSQLVKRKLQPKQMES